MPVPPLIPVLRIAALSFAHPGDPPLFTHWSATFPAGVTLVDGDTGSGKTTLLRILAGELGASGALQLAGAPLPADPVQRQRAVFWLDAADERFDAMTAAALMAAQRQKYPGLDAGAWERHLVGFGLEPHLAKPMYQLSTGSRRKAGLAIALSARAPLTLLDEPAAGLDAASMRYLAQCLGSDTDAAGRATLVVSSQPLDLPQGAATVVLSSTTNTGTALLRQA